MIAVDWQGMDLFSCFTRKILRQPWKQAMAQHQRCLSGSFRLMPGLHLGHTCMSSCAYGRSHHSTGYWVKQRSVTPSGHGCQCKVRERQRDMTESLHMQRLWRISLSCVWGLPHKRHTVLHTWITSLKPGGQLILISLRIHPLRKQELMSEMQHSQAHCIYGRYPLQGLCAHTNYLSSPF